MNPIDPGSLPPDGGADPKPWQKQPQPPGADTGGPVSGGDDGATGSLIEGAADVAGGALDAVGGVADAAGGVLDAAGGCADGCSGCSLALLITLFAAAGTALALFR